MTYNKSIWQVVTSDWYFGTPKNPQKPIVTVTFIVMMDMFLLKIINLLESLALATIRPIVATGLRKRLLLVVWGLVLKLTEDLEMSKMLSKLFMIIPIRKNTLAKDMMHSQLTFGKFVIEYAKNMI